MTTSSPTSEQAPQASAGRFVDALTISLESAELAADQVVDGKPTAAAASFAGLGPADVGVWEHTAGASLDVESDEVFVVLAGHGRVTFESGEMVELVPGRLVRLYAGERTRWDVSETLRKVYVAV